MKILLAIISFLLTNALIAQNGISKPLITEFGEATGVMTSSVIDKTGGRLVSSDRRLEVIIPENAVKKKTIFSIQPVSNLLISGTGYAYKLEPSGIEFNEPILLLLHYNNDVADDEIQKLLGIASQNEKGQWFELTHIFQDTVAKIIGGLANHFSTISSFMSLKLTPSNAKLKVNKKMGLIVVAHKTKRQKRYISTNPRGQILNLDPKYWSGLSQEWYLDEMSLDYDAIELFSRLSPDWFVNGIRDGNSELGVISPGQFISPRYGEPSGDVFFTAPSEVPDNNPVEVTVKYSGFNYSYEGTTIENPKLKCKILIYDNTYILRVEANVNMVYSGSRLNKANYKDVSTAILEYKKDKVILKEVTNFDESWTYADPKCNIKVITQNTGIVHIAAIKNHKITPAQAPVKPNATIEIDFFLLSSVLSQLLFTCPNTKPITEGGYKAGMWAYPQYIKFEAKEGLQTVLEFGRPNSDYHVKITIKKMTDEFSN